MARDTSRGVIETMSPGILTQGFDFNGVWECTRLLIDHRTLTIGERQQVLEGFVRHSCALANAQGGSSLLSISPPSLQNCLRRMGYDVVRAGPVFTDAHDARRYCALQMRDFASAVSAA